jgi:DNA-binding NarL/FixJ family response regulator
MDTKVFLVEDHEVLRQGIADRVAAEPDLHVVGGAATIAEALAGLTDLDEREARGESPPDSPTVVVIDLRLPDGSGVELCREVRSRQPRRHCVFLTSFDADDALFSAVMAGADGYVLKQMVGFELGSAIRTAGAGEPLLDGKVVELARARIQRQRERRDEPARLTGREPEGLDLIVAGMTNREIAERLRMSEDVVRDAVSSLLEKLSWRDLRPPRRAGSAPRLARTPDAYPRGASPAL